MRRRHSSTLGKIDRQRALLAALCDDLAVPLVHLKTSVELITSEDFSKPLVRGASETLSLSAEAGLKLVEAYRYLLKSEEILASPPEALPIGIVLENIAHRLEPFAKLYSTELVVDVQGRFRPVMAHAASLNAALEILTSSLVRAQAAQGKAKKYQLVLGAHKTPDGTVAAGAFSSVQGLSDQSLRAARSLVGMARQPLPSIPPGTASGILIADMLCETLWQPLHAAAHRNLGGLATSLPTSSQLQFV